MADISILQHWYQTSTPGRHFRHPFSSFDFGDDYGIPLSAYTFVKYDKSDCVQWMQWQTYDDCKRWFRANQDCIGNTNVGECMEIYNGETLANILIKSDSSIPVFGINWRVQTSAYFSHIKSPHARVLLSEFTTRTQQGSS